MRLAIARWWQILRSLTTDGAYEQYLAHHRGAHPHEPPLTRQSFYLRQQERKWTGVNRCC